MLSGKRDIYLLVFSKLFQWSTPSLPTGEMSPLGGGGGGGGWGGGGLGAVLASQLYAC